MSELKNAEILHRAKSEEMNRMPGKEIPESRTAGPGKGGSGGDRIPGADRCEGEACDGKEGRQYGILEVRRLRQILQQSSRQMFSPCHYLWKCLLCRH